MTLGRADGSVSRDEALAQGITISGLPIMIKSGGYFDLPNLDLYYRDCVIGGPGAFMVPVRDREQFVEAIKTKIIMEVAERPSYGPTIIPAQAERAGMNCLAGEQQWRDRMGN